MISLFSYGNIYIESEEVVKFRIIEVMRLYERFMACNTPLVETVERTKKEYYEDKPVTCKAVTIELYKVTDSYDSAKVLESIKEFCDRKKAQYTIMLHDQDVYKQDTYNNHVLVGRKGQRKADHYHICIYLKNRLSINDLAIAFGIEDRWIKKLKKDVDFDNMIVYCTHIRYPEEDKHHYPVESFDTNIMDYCQYLYDLEIEKQEHQQNNVVVDFMNYLKEDDYKVSYQKMINILLAEHDLNEINKYYRILDSLIREHNKEFDMIDENGAVKEMLHKVQDDLTRSLLNQDVLINENMKLRGIGE